MPDETDSKKAILDKVNKYAKLIAVLVPGCAVVLKFAHWVYLCGRATHFNIPWVEVPIVDSPNMIIFYLGLACIVLIPNYCTYTVVKRNVESRASKILLCITFLLTGLALMSALLVICCPCAVANEIVASIALWTMIGALFWLLFLGGGVLLAFSDSFGRSRKKSQDKKQSNNEDDSSNKSTAFDNRTKRSIGYALAAFLALIPFVVVFLYGFFSLMSNGVEGLTKDSRDMDCAVIFSTNDSYCIERCEVSVQDKKLTVFVSEYEWIQKIGIKVKNASQYSVEVDYADPVETDNKPDAPNTGQS